MLFKKRGGLLTIEINDQAIDKQIAQLIIRAERTVRDLEASLRKKDFYEKDEDIEKLLALFEEILEDDKKLQEDVEKIRLREQQEAGYVKIPDEQYLLDKTDQLMKMRRALEHLLEILREHPSVTTLKNQILDELFGRMNTLIDAFNNIRSDDYSLKLIYEKFNR